MPMPVGEGPIGWALGVLVPSMGRSFPIDIDEIGEQLPSLERRAGWRAIGSFGEGVISRPSSALGKWGKRGTKKKREPALDCLTRYNSFVLPSKVPEYCISWDCNCNCHCDHGTACLLAVAGSTDQGMCLLALTKPPR